MNNLGAALQQLGAMMQAGQSGPDAGGPVNWAMVTDVARKALVQAGDPSVGDADRRMVTEAVRLADVWLDPAVTFPATTATPAAWSRSEWLEATTPVWRQVVQPIAEHMQQVVGPVHARCRRPGARPDDPEREPARAVPRHVPRRASRRRWRR